MLQACGGHGITPLSAAAEHGIQASCATAVIKTPITDAGAACPLALAVAGTIAGKTECQHDGMGRSHTKQRSVAHQVHGMTDP